MTEIGDIITPGQPVPPDVGEVSDRNGEMWARVAAYVFRRPHRNGRVHVDNLARLEGPLTVTGLIEPPSGALSSVLDAVEIVMTAGRVRAISDDAAPPPTVLRPPSVSDDVVMLSGRDDYLRDGDRWAVGSWRYDLLQVLGREPDGVVLRTTAPRQPRVWPQISAAPADLPTAVDVTIVRDAATATVERWTLGGERPGLYRHDIYSDRSLAELRERGDVREVLGGA